MYQEIYTLAVDYYSKAVSADSAYVYAFGRRAYCYLQIGETDKACIDFKTAAELGGDYGKRMLEEYCK